MLKYQFVNWTGKQLPRNDLVAIRIVKSAFDGVKFDKVTPCGRPGTNIIITVRGHK